MESSTETEVLDLEDFCRALVAALVEQGDRNLTIGDSKIESALPGVLRLLWEEADKQYAAQSRETSYQLMKIIEDLSPDPNTGVFDGFWSAVSKLQPFVLSIANPMFREAEVNLSREDATASLAKLPKVIQHVSRKSADLIVSRLDQL